MQEKQNKDENRKERNQNSACWQKVGNLFFIICRLANKESRVAQKTDR